MKVMMRKGIACAPARAHKALFTDFDASEVVRRRASARRPLRAFLIDLSRI